MTSAFMKPFLKSVWIFAPASGADEFFLQDQALDSFIPEVKKVTRSKRLYPCFISLDREVSQRPIVPKNSFFSDSSSIKEISDSIAAEILIVLMFFLFP